MLFQKSYNLKSENKTLTNFSSKITKSKYFHNKKELSSIDFLKKVNLRINLESNFSSRNTKATTISESNTYDHPSKNKMNKINEDFNMIGSYLKEKLKLNNFPYRIECYDISHIQGTNTVASMVTFINGLSKKSEYKKN